MSFSLLENFLSNRINDLHKQNIKLKILGSKKFSPKLNKLLYFSEKKTSKNDKLQINLAINYGSKSELINAFKKIKKKQSTISEKNLSKHLQTKNIPDPDLLIRTGNTKRLSNFYYGTMLIQKSSLKKSYGLRLMKRIIIELSKNLKILKEILVKYNE